MSRRGEFEWDTVYRSFSIRTERTRFIRMPNKKRMATLTRVVRLLRDEVGQTQHSYLWKTSAEVYGIDPVVIERSVMQQDKQKNNKTKKG